MLEGEAPHGLEGLLMHAVVPRSVGDEEVPVGEDLPAAKIDAAVGAVDRRSALAAAGLHPRSLVEEVRHRGHLGEALREEVLVDVVVHRELGLTVVDGVPSQLPA